VGEVITVHYPFGGPGWGFSIWMMIAMAVFWLVFLAGIVLLIVWAANRSRPAGGSALDVLNRRYAQGEISREQYEQMKRDILSGGT